MVIAELSAIREIPTQESELPLIMPTEKAPPGIGKSSGLTIDVTGHMHTDNFWNFLEHEGHETFRNSLRTQIKLARNNPDYTAALSSAGLFEYLEKTDPEIFEEITDMVRVGKLEPVGGMWVEPDEHLPSGEGFVRQLLYGQDFFQNKFGRIARTYWAPDAWGGRPKNLPDILNDAGLEYMVYKRPERHQSSRPDLVEWHGENGGKITVYHLYEYVSGNVTHHTQLARVARGTRAPYKRGFMPFGIGDHGGGPTQEQIYRNRGFNAHPDWPIINQTTPEKFFDIVTSDGTPIPMVSGDFDSPSQGHYASDSLLKAGVRRSENALYLAEAADVLRDYYVDKDHKRIYPSVDMGNLWKKLLPIHFHDSGTSIPEAHLEAREKSAGIIRDAIYDRTLNLQAIASKIDIQVPKDMERLIYPIVVFNLNGHEMTQFIVENTTDPDLKLFNKDLSKTHVLEDSQGNISSIQCISADAWPYKRTGAMVTVKPGWETFKFTPKPEGYKDTSERILTSDGYAIENDKYRMEIDEGSGGISLYDKEDDVDVFSSIAALPVVYYDHGDAWGQERYDEVAEGLHYKPQSIEKWQDGILTTSFKVDYELMRGTTPTGTKISQEFQMYRDSNQIDVKVHSFLTEPEIAVKLEFPLNIRTYPEATYELPYSTTTRPMGNKHPEGFSNMKEVPGGTWVDITGEHERMDGSRIRTWRGATIANNAKYSYSAGYNPEQNDSSMYIMITRSGTFTTRPGTDDERKHQRYLDVGESQDFTYTIRPHAESWQEAGTYTAGIEVNRPLIVIGESAHPGYLPETHTIYSSNKANIVIGAVKKSENGKGYIVRLNEAIGQRTPNSTINFFGRELSATFGQHELKSFFIPYDKSAPVSETSILEKPKDSGVWDS